MTKFVIDASSFDVARKLYIGTAELFAELLKDEQLFAEVKAILKVNAISAHMESVSESILNTLASVLNEFGSMVLQNIFINGMTKEEFEHKFMARYLSIARKDSLVGAVIERVGSKLVTEELMFYDWYASFKSDIESLNLDTITSIEMVGVRCIVHGELKGGTND